MSQRPTTCGRLPEPATLDGPRTVRRSPCWKAGNRVQEAPEFGTRQPPEGLHDRRADSDPPRPLTQPRNPLRTRSTGILEAVLREREILSGRSHSVVSPPSAVLADEFDVIVEPHT